MKTAYLPSLAKTLLIAIAFSAQSIPLPAQAFSESLDSWEQVQNRAATALQFSEYGTAERLFKEAVSKARAFGPGDLRLAKSEGDLGRLLTIRGRFSEAEPVLEEALRVKEVAIGNDGGALIPAMGTLVRFYLTGGTASKADPLADKMLTFIEGTLTSARGPKLTLKKGAPLQGWAGTASTTVRDPLIEWAISCDDIGNLFLARGNFEMAEKLYKAALDVKSTVLGKEHLSLANSYDSLGGLCLARNQFEDAESYFKDALSMTERIQPPEHPQVYARLDKLAKCLIKQGKYPQAEELYLRASNVYKATPPKNGNESRALFALGSLYVEEKNYTAAAPILEQALQLSEQYNGSDSIALVPYLEKYAYGLYYLGRKTEVDELRARANEITSAETQPSQENQ